MVWKCKHAKKNHILHRFGSLGVFFPSMNPVPYVFSLVFSCWHSWTLICFDRDHFKCSERDNNSGRIEELETSEKNASEGEHGPSEEADSGSLAKG